MLHRFLSALLVCVAAISAAAQVQPPLASDTGTFEVASIRENPSGALDGGFNQQGTRFTVTNLELSTIIWWAYRVNDYQVLNMPAWAASTRYNIEATLAEADPSDDNLRGMLRNLLADRFGLRARREQRELPMYNLMAAREDRQLGPNLTTADIDCAAVRCTAFATTAFYRAMAEPIGSFVRQLEALLRAPVVDRTGLSGRYRIDVRWAPPGAQPTPQGQLNDATVEQRAAVFTAVQEQLGLRLQAARGPIDVIVVDAINRPTPN